jgi:hypothetical protein
MSIKKLTIGQVIYINGAIETEKLAVNKIGTKYITFANSKHRFLKQYGLIQRWRDKSYELGGVDVFDSAEAAESYLAERMNESINL